MNRLNHPLQSLIAPSSIVINGLSLSLFTSPCAGGKTMEGIGKEGARCIREAVKCHVKRGKVEYRKYRKPVSGQTENGTEGREHFPTDRGHLERHHCGSKPVCTGEICFYRF